ncbi:MAG: phage major tail tube protein [Lachnospiraceae bacterium]|nr:phage major tail tube protein [Lachnospiraceae bacterium]
MSNTIDEMVLSYAMYEDGSEFMGTTEATLPDVEYMTDTIKGAGISGEVTEIITGYTAAMKTTLSFRTVGKWTAKLLEPRVHNIDLRVAQQYLDTGTRNTGVNMVKHVMKIKPVKTTMGKVAAAASADASGEYTVLYYALYVDGKKITEVDPMNFIHIINGVDYLAKIRKALGKA